MATAEITVYRQDIPYSTDLATLACGTCGIPFAIPASKLESLQADGDWFWCPNGHKIHYSETEEQRLRKRLASEKAKRERAERDRDSAKAQAVHEADQKRAAQRQVTAYKGTVTKMKKRTANGVCPCCSRTFAQLARHMASQHPDYDKEA